MMIMDALKNDDAHAMHMLDATITLGCYTPCHRVRSVSRSFPWLLDSSGCWIIAQYVNISM